MVLGGKLFLDGDLAGSRFNAPRWRFYSDFTTYHSDKTRSFFRGNPGKISRTPQENPQLPSLAKLSIKIKYTDAVQV